VLNIKKLFVKGVGLRDL